MSTSAEDLAVSTIKLMLAHFGILQLELVPFIQKETPHYMMWGMRFATVTRATFIDYSGLAMVPASGRIFK